MEENKEQPENIATPDTGAADVDKKEVAKKTKSVKRKKKVSKTVPTANVYIQATYNNTMMTVTDLTGDTLAWSSAGACGFRGPKKATPYAAGVITRTVVEKIKPYGVNEANVFVKGVGSGRESAVRSLHSQGITVLSIKDITPIPHNGCRRRKPRRV